jgi:hypothetical protein
MSCVVTVPELLDGHTVLDIECLDRIYLNGYVPTLQVGGQVLTFLHDHRRMPVASPAVFEQIGIRFRQAVGRFAEMNEIPMVKFRKGMQAICDRLGPAGIQAFFDRWMSRIPVPLSAADQAAGYWWELSLRQVETSRTLVFDAPRQARAFFEALVADNLDLGRPEHVEILFKRSPRGRKPKDQAGGVFKTRWTRRLVSCGQRAGRPRRTPTAARTPTWTVAITSPTACRTRWGARPILAEALQAEVDAYIARCRAVVAYPPGNGVPFPRQSGEPVEKTVGAEAAPPLLTQLQELASLNVRR